MQLATIASDRHPPTGLVSPTPCDLFCLHMDFGWGCMERHRWIGCLVQGLKRIKDWQLRPRETTRLGINWAHYRPGDSGYLHNPGHSFKPGNRRQHVPCLKKWTIWALLPRWAQSLRRTGKEWYKHFMKIWSSIQRWKHRQMNLHKSSYHVCSDRTYQSILVEQHTISDPIQTSP
jgi:hypothetical protein